MSPTFEQDLYRFIEAHLQARLRDLNVDSIDVTRDLNMIDTGVLDSMGFIELVADIEDTFDVEVDLEAYRPEELSLVSGLMRCVMDGAVEGVDGTD